MNTDYTQDVSFWKRLKSFVRDIQVNCMMGDEEKEMILSNCNSKIKQLPFKDLKITKEFLNEAGFIETIGHELKISKDKSISIAHNDLENWYLGFRNINSGEVDDFVIIRADLKYQIEVIDFIRSVNAYSPIFESLPLLG